MRVLDLLVDREVERAVALGFDLGLVMESSEVRATPSAAPPQPRPGQNSRQGKTPKPASAVPSRQQQRSDQGRKPVISEQDSCWKGGNPDTIFMGSDPLSPPPFYGSVPGTWVTFYYSENRLNDC